MIHSANFIHQHLHTSYSKSHVKSKALIVINLAFGIILTQKGKQDTITTKNQNFCVYMKKYV